jgi:AraC family transcriptional regulator
MHTELLLDRALTPEVRTRAWRYCGDRLPDWPIGAHPGFEVAWPRRGALRYRIHARTFEVPMGMAMLVPPQHEHRTQMAPHSEATSLWLGHELVASVAELVRPEASRFEPRVVSAAPLAALGDVLLNEATLDQPGAYLTADALGEALVVQLLRGLGAKTEPGTGDRRVDAAIERIESGYAEALTVDDLARAAGMSRYHFSRAFRARTGSSPYQYLLRTRVRRAAELLRRGRRNVTEAALEVGFLDLGRFSRAFQREIGVPPSQYRAHVSQNVAHQSHFQRAG